jgi:hypothetical protein
VISSDDSGGHELSAPASSDGGIVLRLVFVKNRIRVEKKGNRAMSEERRGARMGAWTRVQASPVLLNVEHTNQHVIHVEV